MDIEGEQHIKENANMYPESWNRLLQYVMCKIAKEDDDHLNLKLCYAEHLFRCFLSVFSMG
jgi:hypothetical protein